MFRTGGNAPAVGIGLTCYAILAERDGNQLQLTAVLLLRIGNLFWNSTDKKSSKQFSLQRNYPFSNFDCWNNCLFHSSSHGNLNHYIYAIYLLISILQVQTRWLDDPNGFSSQPFYCMQMPPAVPGHRTFLLSNHRAATT